uniref:Putative capsid protein n=1 Tax=viral metagenome TaxID=1070528 RepID=A0A6M3J4U9_9ZZZZ
MAMDLVQAAKLTTDVLLKGVIETIITESQLLKHLPFIDIVGNGLTYNQENTLPSANFYDVGDTWTESTPTFTQQTATLKILGGDADVDEFLRQTRSNLQNLKAIVTDLKSKAIARKFEQYAIYGNTSSDAKAFNGLHALVSTAQVSSVDSYQVHASTSGTGAAGSIRKLKQLLRMVKPNGPQFLLMSRVTRDDLSTYAETNYAPIKWETEFGIPIMRFGGVPVICTDWMTATETNSSSTERFSAETGGANTSIFAARFGEGELAGCQNGGINVKDLGDLETKDATRVRIKWYVSMALFRTCALARYDGITGEAWGA